MAEANRRASINQSDEKRRSSIIAGSAAHPMGFESVQRKPSETASAYRGVYQNELEASCQERIVSISSLFLAFLMLASPAWSTCCDMIARNFGGDLVEPYAP
jgi:hypothetical protein